MGAKSVPLNKFVKYLRSLGLEHYRSNDSHDLYDYPSPHKKLLRPVTVDQIIKMYQCYIYTQI